MCQPAEACEVFGNICDSVILFDNEEGYDDNFIP